MSFEPVSAEHARALIVGTWPSPKSRELGFYYGHPQNRFWPLLSALFGSALPESIEDKKKLIKNNGLALWDVLDSCSISGASDASIKDEVPNDIASFCRGTEIHTVLCNGKTAYELYLRFNPGGPAAVRLPSTSPANASWSFERLLEAWGVLKDLSSRQGAVPDLAAPNRPLPRPAERERP